MKKPRRAFLRAAGLQSAATLAAGFVCDGADAQEQPFSVTGSLVAPGAPGPLPQVRLGRYSVSRLIVGGNPFYGYSHFNRLLSDVMVEWCTPERVCQILRQCEQQGINTWQISHTERAMSDLRRHRAEGGKLQWILLSHAEIENDHALLREVAALQPIGIVHHGGSAERKRRAGQLGKVREFLKAVRDTGVLVGLSAHDPELIEQVESDGWDIDFYMTSLYHRTRTPEQLRKLLGHVPLGEVYLPEDPPRMCGVIRKTSKTCLAYKVLAAGRVTDSPQQVERAFRFAFENIKPRDAVIIGMYPRYSDQVRENADLVRRLARV